MKARDIMILAGLITLILGLTIAEKYSERQREIQQREDAVAERAVWEQRITASLDKRWQDLSSQLRRSLDSMAGEVVAGGVPRESLASVIVDSAYSGVASARGRATVPGAAQSQNKSVPADSLAHLVLREYEKGLAALPADLSVYERRVANNEVASLVRARYGLSTPRFDSLLKRAGQWH